MAQRIHENVCVVSAVKTKGHLLQVSREMFDTDFVPCSHESTFQERECRLDSIGGHIATDVFSRAVVDSLMLRVVVSGNSEVVEPGFVGHNHVNCGGYVLRNEVIEFFLVKVTGSDETGTASAFLESDNRNFVVNPVSTSDAFALASEIAFVDFDGTAKHPLSLASLSHGSADSVAQVPSSFIRAFMLAPNSALELSGRHALAGLYDKQHSGKPNIQRKVCIVEDRLGGYAKLIEAFFAFKLAVTRKVKNVLTLAAQAFNVIRPTQFYQQSAALFVGRKHLSEVAECHG